MGIVKALRRRVAAAVIDLVDVLESIGTIDDPPVPPYVGSDAEGEAVRPLHLIRPSTEEQP